MRRILGRKYKCDPILAEVVDLAKLEWHEITSPAYKVDYAVECEIAGLVYEFETDKETFEKLEEGDVILVFRHRVWNRRGQLIEDYYDI